MLTMLGSSRQCCDGWTRRETLRAGALSALGGLGLSHALKAQASPAATGKAKNVLLLYLMGGAPTQDMFDLKPEAPSGIRSEFRPIATAVPGVSVCEHLPGVAKWMRRAALIRSMNHKSGCHNTLPSYTGKEGLLDNIVTTKDAYPPSMGSVIERLRATGELPGATDMPAYHFLPCYLGWGQSIRRPGPYGGFLGKRFDPLFAECKPSIDHPPDKPYHGQVVRGQPTLPQAAIADPIALDRLSDRRSLLSQFDEQLKLADARGAAGTYDKFQRQAFDVLTSGAVRRAFDLEQENAPVRDRYGRNLFGQSALIGRRLLEAGARFVNVTWDCYWERLAIHYECWDTHARNFAVLKDNNLPVFDQTYAALMEDLEARGLLDETLVLVMSEMGRAPRMNGAAGRDHWTYCYSVMLAGAGIRGGTVHGASDAHAAFVRDFPVSPADLCATVYAILGIDPESTVPDAFGRPVPISHGGRPVVEVMA